MFEFTIWKFVLVPLTILGIIFLPIFHKVAPLVISPYSKADTRKRLFASSVDISVCLTFYYLFTSFKGIHFLAIIGLYILLKDVLFKGRSIGKLLFGLIVIQVTNGKPCGIWQSIGRNILLIIPGINMVTCFFEFVLIYKDKHGIRLGDRIANTQVIEGMEVPELAKYFQLIFEYHHDKTAEGHPERKFIGE